MRQDYVIEIRFFKDGKVVGRKNLLAREFENVVEEFILNGEYDKILVTGYLISEESESDEEYLASKYNIEFL